VNTKEVTGTVRNIAVMAAAVALMLGPTRPVQADLITFLQFKQQDPNGQNFIYTNESGLSGVFGVIDGGNPVKADIATQIRPNGLGEFQDAHLTVSTSTTSPSTLIPIVNVLSERFPDETNTMTFTLDTPFNGDSDLLTVTFNGYLAGQLGGRSAGLVASQSAHGINFVQFSSNVLDLTGWSNFGFALSFSSVISDDGNGLEQDGGNIYESFTTAGTGTFNAERPVIPEPTSFGLLGIGLALSAAGSLRRRQFPRTGR
jgi:hypothetical protein